MPGRPGRGLAALLAAGAAGLLADSRRAAADRPSLLADQDRLHHAVHRRRPSPLSGQALAHVRWKAAARALAGGQLPAPAATGHLPDRGRLAAGVPVRLRDAVTGLDDANLAAVAVAIMAAGGCHRR